MTDPELITAYWKCYQKLVKKMATDEYFWAWEEVNDAVDRPRFETIQLLLDLAASAPDDITLSYLGVGPIEDLLNKGNEAILKEFENAIRQTPRLREATKDAWVDISKLPASLAKLLHN